VERRVGLIRHFAVGFGALSLSATLAGAQTAPNQLNTETLPPPPSLGPIVSPPAAVTDHAELIGPSSEAAKPALPKASDRPERDPIAVIRVLDKVTAETLRFAAPVGRRVRYRSLVFEVKACEIWGAGSAQPRPSAYLIIQSDVGVASGPLQEKQIYKGWMFAQAPGVHPLRHPIYDAWLETCSAAAPVS
jgi:hypothetical protein